MDNKLKNSIKMCGVTKVCFNDASSSFINKLMGLSVDSFNALGFYYYNSLVQKYYLVLYNTHNICHPLWVYHKSSFLHGGKIELCDLLQSQVVTKVICYPLTQSLLTTKNVVRDTKNVVRDTKNVVREEIVSEFMNSIKNLHFMESLDEKSFFVKTFANGYTLVNAVLLQLMRSKDSDLLAIDNNIISCDFLQQPMYIKNCTRKVDNITTEDSCFINRSRDFLMKFCDLGESKISCLDIKDEMMDIERVSYEELVDILIYADSMGGEHCMNLKNQIVQELAKRRK